LAGVDTRWDAFTLAVGVTDGVVTGEAVIVALGSAVGVVLLPFTTIPTTPAPSMKTINVASSLWKPFSAASPLGRTSV
jgi:hypothetical protein